MPLRANVASCWSGCGTDCRILPPLAVPASGNLEVARDHVRITCPWAIGRAPAPTQEASRPTKQAGVAAASESGPIRRGGESVAEAGDAATQASAEAALAGLAPDGGGGTATDCRTQASGLVNRLPSSFHCHFYRSRSAPKKSCAEELGLAPDCPIIVQLIDSFNEG